MKVKDQYNRIVQAGTQNRSDTGLQPMFQWLKEGHIGKVKTVRGLAPSRKPMATPSPRTG